MDDVHERIRELVDAAAAPVTAEEARRRVHRERGRPVVWLGAAAVLVVALIGSLLVAIGGEDDGSVGTELGAGGGPAVAPVGWRPVADSPLSPRSDATVLAIGEVVVVFGGHDTTPCVPEAICDRQLRPPFRDAAAYDPANDSWRTLATVPDGLGNEPATAVVGEVAYVLGRPIDGGPPLFARYDLATDTWTTLPSPGGALDAQLAVADVGIVAWQTSDGPEANDQVFDIAAGTWAPLPEDPLPASFDRAMIPTDAGLLLVSAALNGDPGQSYGAALLDGSGNWTTLADEGIEAYWQGWFDTPIGVVNPTRGGDRIAGVVDPATGEWAPLADAPTAPGAWAALAPEGGERYVSAEGWAFDVTDRSWTDLGRPDGATVEGQGSVWIGDELFVWGGVRVDGGVTANTDVGWVWSAPSPDARETSSTSAPPDVEVVDDLDPALAFVPAVTVDDPTPYVIDDLDPSFVPSRVVESVAGSRGGADRQVVFGNYDPSTGRLEGPSAVLEVGGPDVIFRIDLTGDTYERHTVVEADDVLLLGTDVSGYVLDLDAGVRAARVTTTGMSKDEVLDLADDVLAWVRDGEEDPATLGIDLPILSDDAIGRASWAPYREVSWCIPRASTDETWYYVSLSVRSGVDWNPLPPLADGATLVDLGWTHALSAPASLEWTPEPGVVVTLSSNHPATLADLAGVAQRVRPATPDEATALASIPPTSC